VCVEELLKDSTKPRFLPKILEMSLANNSSTPLAIAKFILAVLLVLLPTGCGADDACVEDPTVDCLANQVSILADGSPYPYKSTKHLDAKLLATLGRYDEALQVLSGLPNKYVTNIVRTNVHRRAAQTKVIASARSADPEAIDLSPIEKLAELKDLPHAPPVIITSSYYLAALDLLGQQPYNTSVLANISRARARANKRNQPGAIRMARRIEELIPKLPEKFRKSKWLKAAEIYALADRPEDSFRALRNGLPAGLRVQALIPKMVVAVDPERVMAVLHETGMRRGKDYLTIAQAMLERDVPRERVKQVLDIATEYAITGTSVLGEGGIEFKGGMEFAVLREIAYTRREAGDISGAEALARRMVGLARTAKHSQFPWISPLIAAATLIDLGLKREGRVTIEEVIASLPKDKSNLPGVGFRIGPITFSNWGNGTRGSWKTATAYAGIAAEFARLGDLERHDQVIEMVHSDRRAAARDYVLRKDLPVKRVRQLIERASPNVRGKLFGPALHGRLILLSQSPQIFHRTRIAPALRGHFIWEDREDAIWLANRLMDHPEYASFDDFVRVATVGVIVEDPLLSKRGLAAAVNYALESQDPTTIAKAAEFWHTFFPQVNIAGSG